MPTNHLSYPDLLEMLEVPNKRSGTLALKPEYQVRVVAAKDRMIRCGKWKLVFQPMVNGMLLRLYDLDADPECRWDVSDSQSGVTASLWESLQAWLAMQPPVLPGYPDRSGTRD